MPTLATSLVGFMEQQEAINYLRLSCVPPVNSDDASLIAEWQTARAKLGPPMSKAGAPDIEDIPASQANYMAQLATQPWVANALNNSYPGSKFCLVEIEPLLAFQFAIDGTRSRHHCSPFSQPPTLDQLLLTCLPLAPPAEPIQVTQGPQSMLITSRSLNFRSLAQGFLNTEFVGMYVGLALPLVHVVRFNGRCYLYNGFHRAFGSRLAGATHVPCLFRDVNDAASAAISPPGTFGLPLLESNNPPTMGHYTQGRAHDVNLRIYTRALHVSWAEYAVPAE
jgi:hypothetical protein